MEVLMTVIIVMLHQCNRMKFELLKLTGPSSHPLVLQLEASRQRRRGRTNCEWKETSPLVDIEQLQ